MLRAFLQNLFKKIDSNKNKILYLSIIIFIIPLIVLSIFILSSDAKTSTLENIITSPDQDKTECYYLTYNFIKKKKNQIYIYH